MYTMFKNTKVSKYSITLMIFIICLGFTLLYLACQYKSIELLRDLVENGVDLLDAMDRDGATAKDYCCRGCFDEYDCEDKCKLIQGISIILILELLIIF